MLDNKNFLLHSEHYNKSSRHFQKFFAISPKKADFNYLGEILSYFSNLPYENISKIIKRHHHFEDLQKIRLPDEVMADHTRHHLGGTCFSLTFFLQTILHNQGFSCYPIMADMRWGKNVHCALIVLYDQKKYLVDPGYLLNQPMELHAEKPRVLHSETSGVELAYRPKDRTYHLYTFNREQTKWRYRFRDRSVPPDEFLKYWLDSFGWNTMHGFCLTKVEKGRMVYIHKNHMRETTFNGKQNFNIKHKVHETIHAVFGIDPVLVEEAQSALAANLAKERELGLWIPKEKQSVSS